MQHNKPLTVKLVEYRLITTAQDEIRAALGIQRLNWLHRPDRKDTWEAKYQNVDVSIVLTESSIGVWRYEWSIYSNPAGLTLASSWQTTLELAKWYCEHHDALNAERF